ncbi:MAG: UvrD-helicase domain-containing protein, partial [bacterium]|nr:UvrD-helicase domain-containing protein [bacterium]
MAELLENLNDAQKEAVIHEKGPLMIVAGAGTGKTTVITRRIARLIQDGLAKPTEILALTFTEKAAGEMEERVDQMLPMGYLDLSIQTFHAFCERVLREHGMEIGISRDFGIVTELDAWLLVRKHFDKFDLKYYRPLGNPMRYLKGILQHFSSAKDAQVTPESYKAFIKSKEKEFPKEEIDRLHELADAFATYESVLHAENVLDFGGLIQYTLKLIEERPGILKKLQDRYKFVLVDEFQDTNAAQYELVKAIALPENNITVVGDDDQSIYKFRGASLANILKFDSDYPDTKHVVLTQNYRSHQEILDASHKLIQYNNPNRLEIQTGLSKKLVAHREEGGKVHHLHFESLEAEAK